tara:strand:+ start:2657 stop:4420 length:1764 start_codon:yes stop_codon:yes gene_type:complete
MADATLQMVISQLRDNKVSNDSKLDVVSQSIMRMNDALNGLLDSSRQDRMDQLERDRETRRQANKATTQQNTGPPGKGLGKGLGGPIGDLLGNGLKALGLGVGGLALGRLLFKGLKIGALGLALNFAAQELIDYAFENFSLFDGMDESDKKLIKTGAGLAIGGALTAKLFGLGMKGILAIGLAAFIAPWAIDAIKKYFDPDGDGKFKFELPDWTGMPDINVDLNDPMHSGILTGLVTVAGALVFSMLPSVLKLFAIRLPIIAATWAASAIGAAYLKRSMRLAGVEADLRAKLDKMATEPSSRRGPGTKGPGQNVRVTPGGGRIPRGFNPYALAPEGRVQAYNGRFYPIDSPQGRTIVTSFENRTGITKGGANVSQPVVPSSGRVSLVKSIFRGVAKGLVPVGIALDMYFALTDTEKRNLGVSLPERFVDSAIEGTAGLFDLGQNYLGVGVNKLFGTDFRTDYSLSGQIRDSFLQQDMLKLERDMLRSQELGYPVGAFKQMLIYQLRDEKALQNRKVILSAAKEAGSNQYMLDQLLNPDKYGINVQRGPAMPGFNVNQFGGNDTTITNTNVIDFVAASNDRDHLENNQ